MATVARMERWFISLILLLPEVLLKGITSPPEGFKFNCGHDTCVFPLQFCNVIKQYCEVCTIHACNELNVSSQCDQRCEELKQKVEILPAEGQSLGALTDKVTRLSYMVYILLALLILWVLYRIGKYVMAYRERTRDKLPDEGSQGYEPVSHDDQPINGNPNRVEPTAPPERPVSPRTHNTGSSVSVYQPSPSGQAGNYSTRADCKFMPKTTSESPAEVQPSAGHNHLYHVEVHNSRHFSSSFGEFPPLQSNEDTSSICDDNDATALKNDLRTSDDIEDVSDNMDHQSPQRSGPSCNAFDGMAEAYTDKRVGHTVHRVSSAKSITSSASHGSDSGNYSSATSIETESVAMKKRQTFHKNNILAADV
ncbi:uncharacterized protein LOC117336102 isoform X2 [Pecten maximus]|uniref:uncharacterized protein LOC117336102 isoform X2 n=1 Tax=Pecten maximus TaxID=6579 RepID=UPI001458CBEF|nr:uncharacterized protein LOC117336102 isoform X2 [Pecten maximus]